MIPLFKSGGRLRPSPAPRRGDPEPETWHKERFRPQPFSLPFAPESEADAGPSCARTRGEGPTGNRGGGGGLSAHSVPRPAPPRRASGRCSLRPPAVLPSTGWPGRAHGERSRRPRLRTAGRALLAVLLSCRASCGFLEGPPALGRRPGLEHLPVNESGPGFCERKNGLGSSVDSWSLSSESLVGMLPIDPVYENYVRKVRNCIFSIVYPTPFKSRIHLVAVSKDVLEDILDLDLSVSKTNYFIQLVSGEKIVSGSIPLAYRYGGHQFGTWADQLGDRRAHLIGIYTNRYGERWELQLKGSGKTPYSRNGDGRAVLRSSVREFLASEALHYLGIPTSRALSLVVSDDDVWRDNFYNGNIQKERGAVVLRIAKSWFRIGSLEILAHYGELDLLRKLLNFVIQEHFPSVDVKDPNRYLKDDDLYYKIASAAEILELPVKPSHGFFSNVVSGTAHLIASWMSVGFAHGVCNTDNFSLLSVTIDYGPFGFMEAYDPNFVPNTSDDERKYKIGNQANVGMFNLNKLLQVLNPLLDPSQKQLAAQILVGYSTLYYTRFKELFKAKLGLLGEKEGDDYLVAFLLHLMEETKADFTMTFRELSEITQAQLKDFNVPEEFWALKTLSRQELFSDWVTLYLLRLKSNMNDSDSRRRKRMTSVNPRYVLKNWMAESAVRKAEMNDFSEVHLLQQVLQCPFQKQSAAEKAGYSSPTPLWANGLKVSCSS
ncbi:selenoprotein O [Vombatus ursinus]|uniref:selenoprotein O n=1 Tax=Vombatus ursinus TaxID=29139 RepID=UPI000FFD6626|nr:selenoprotein O [Vombatus ursinus]